MRDRPVIGFYLNNRTTASLTRALVAAGSDLPFEPLFLCPSDNYDREILGDWFPGIPRRIIGCDFPWRTRKRFGAWLYFYRRCLRELNPKSVFRGLSALVLFKDDGTMDRVLAIRAREIGLPVLCIQEEAIYEMPGSSSGRLPREGRLLQVFMKQMHPLLPTGPVREKGLLSDCNLVYGTKKKKRLMECGYPEAQIHVCGHPLYDDVALLEPDSGPPPRIVFFAHQQTFDGHKEEFAWYEALLKGCEIANATLHFKFHPRSRRRAEELRSAFPNAGERLEIITIGDVQSERLHCGLFVTGDSAAVNRALADGVVPLLLHGVNPGGRRLDLADRGAGLGAESPSEVPECIQSFFEDPSIRASCLSHRDEAVHAHVGPLDGLAVSRYNDAICQVAISRGRG